MKKQSVLFKNISIVILVLAMMALNISAFANVDVGSVGIENSKKTISIEYYNNTFDNGVKDCVKHSDASGTFEFIDGHSLETVVYDDNTGIGSIQNGEWGYDIFNCTFARPIENGVVNYSFDTSRLENESVMNSLIQLNNVSDQTSINVISIGSSSGDNYVIKGYGTGTEQEYGTNEVYNVKMEIDLDNRVVRTYVDDKFSCVQTISADFKLYNIKLNMRNSMAYIDNIKLEQKLYESSADSVKYNNTFDNGKSDCVKYTDTNGNLAFTEGHKLQDAEYDGNKGIGSTQSGQWSYDIFTYTFTNPVETGVVNYSFDVSRLANETIINSLIQLNNVSGQTSINAIYIGSSSGVKYVIKGYGNGTEKEYGTNEVYNVKMEIDLDTRVIRTYINDDFAYEGTVSEGFKLYNIKFNMRNSAAYIDNLKVEHTTDTFQVVSADTGKDLTYADVTFNKIPAIISVNDVEVKDSNSSLITVSDVKHVGTHTVRIILNDVLADGTYNIRIKYAETLDGILICGTRNNGEIQVLTNEIVVDGEKVYAYALNTTDSSIVPVMIVRTVDDAGVLSSVKIFSAKNTLEKGEAEKITADLKGYTPGTTDIFLWGSLDNIYPLCKSVSY